MLLQLLSPCTSPFPIFQKPSTEHPYSYVLDGNALGQTATEAVHRRKFIEPTQPNTIVVSIGYPVTNSSYSDQRNIDFQIGDASTPPGTSGADTFINFIDEHLKPFVQKTVFPNVEFVRDGLYGHSFGGFFTLYTLLKYPEKFDVFLAASPGTFVPGNLDFLLSLYAAHNTTSTNSTKPALKMSYGTLEVDPIKRRTETEDEFEARQAFYKIFNLRANVNTFVEAVGNASVVRNQELSIYEGSNHMGVAAAALADGLDYFVDW